MGEWISNLAGEVRYGARVLRRHSGGTTLIVLTLALGIGGVSAVAAIMKGVLYAPLPYPQGEELVLLQETRGDNLVSVSYPNYRDWRERSRTFESLAAYQFANLTMNRPEGARRLRAYRAEAELFDVLGVPALHGRLFTRTEDATGGAPVAVIAHHLWRDAFGGAMELSELRLELDGEMHDVVGVMPPEFDFRSAADVWVPLGRQVAGSELENRGTRAGLYVVGRLAAGQSEAAARVEMADIGSELARAYPDENRDVGVQLRTLRDTLVGDADRTILIVLVAVSLLLVVACVNVANLLAARSAMREGEVAVRLAVGGAWGGIARQFTIESLLLSLAGGALGTGLAYLAVEAVGRAGLGALPRAEFIRLDATVLATTLGLATAVGLATAIAPIVAFRSGRLRKGLGSYAAGITGRRGAFGRSALVSVQVGLSVLMLVGATLVTRSLGLIFSEDLGFETADRVSFRLELSGSEFADRPALARDILARLEVEPGVLGAGIIEPLPLSGRDRTNRFWVEGRPYSGADDLENSDYAPASSGYFEAMGIPLIAGRNFESTDDGSPSVVLVSRSTAARFWPDQDPLGRTLVGGGPDSGNPTLTVVGVVEDVRQFGVREAARNQVYFHYEQLPLGGTVVAHTTPGQSHALASRVRGIVAEVDPSVAIFDLATLDALFDRSVQSERNAAWALTAFGSLALALTLFGVYAVVERSSSQRMREMAVKAAFGAARGTLMVDVLRGAMVPVLAGIGLGLTVAVVMSRALASLLYEVQPSDPVTYGMVALGVAAAALLASMRPSIRAATRNPVEALRP